MIINYVAESNLFQVYTETDYKRTSPNLNICQWTWCHPTSNCGAENPIHSCLAHYWHLAHYGDQGLCKQFDLNPLKAWYIRAAVQYWTGYTWGSGGPSPSAGPDRLPPAMTSCEARVRSPSHHHCMLGICNKTRGDFQYKHRSACQGDEQQRSHKRCHDLKMITQMPFFTGFSNKLRFSNPFLVSLFTLHSKMCSMCLRGCQDYYRKGRDGCGDYLACRCWFPFCIFSLILICIMYWAVLQFSWLPTEPNQESQSLKSSCTNSWDPGPVLTG